MHGGAALGGRKLALVCERSAGKLAEPQGSSSGGEVCSGEAGGGRRVSVAGSPPNEAGLSGEEMLLLELELPPLLELEL